MTKKEIAEKYIRKYPEMQMQTISKLLLKKEPAYFANLEQARAIVRYVRGKFSSGKKNAVPDLKIEERLSTAPATIPIPDSEELKPYVLPVAFNDFILAGDFHIPNHRTIPINAMMEYSAKNGIKKLFINGDFLDNTPFTRHFRTPVSKTDVFDYFEMAEQMLMFLKTQFDEVYWHEGNHDFWYKRWLIQRAPELYGDPYYDLETRLGLIDKKVRWIPQEFIIKAGKLSIVHGHYMMKGGVSPARTLFMRAKTDMICSHVHKRDSHTAKLDGRMARTYTTGCMCSLTPDYSPQSGESNHGFAHIKIERSGDFDVLNYMVDPKGKLIL